MAQDSESHTRTVIAGGARAVLHHVEMRVEGRDLVDFGERELHLLRERGEMRGGEMAVVVLDQMQMLDQQIAPARPVGEQRAHLVERRRVDLAALGRARRPAAAAGLWLLLARIHQATFTFICRNMAFWLPRRTRS